MSSREFLSMFLLPVMILGALSFLGSRSSSYRQDYLEDRRRRGR